MKEIPTGKLLVEANKKLQKYKTDLLLDEVSHKLQRILQTKQRKKAKSSPREFIKKKMKYKVDKELRKLRSISKTKKTGKGKLMTSIKNILTGLKKIGDYQIPNYAKLYVVKRLNISSDILPSIEMETKTLEKIKKLGCRSNILCMKEWYKDGKYVYIVTQAFGGDGDVQQLGEFIKEHKTRKLSIQKILKIMYYLIDGVDKIHNYYNIGHNDLKPANIIINKNSLETQIIDFGLSCIDSIAECDLIGTPKYSEPNIQKQYQESIYGYLKQEGIDLYDFLMMSEEDKIKILTNHKFSTSNNSKLRVRLVQKKDVYSLGRTFSDLMGIVDRKNEIYNKLEKLIKIMMETEPSIRPDIETVFKMFKKDFSGFIKEKINIKQYKIKENKLETEENRYINLKRMGGGSFGQAYLCIDRIDEKTKKPVVIRNLKGEIIPESDKPNFPGMKLIGL